MQSLTWAQLMPWGLLQALPDPSCPPPAGLPGAASAGPAQHHAPLHSLHQAQQPWPGADLPPGGGNSHGAGGLCTEPHVDKARGGG